jgi:hypothetical protein
MAQIEYGYRNDQYYYNVTFINNSTNKVLTKGFNSFYNALQFKMKLVHSKKCTLISYNF